MAQRNMFLLMSFFFMPFSVLQAGEQYSNPEKHFSLTLPDNWIYIPTEELSDNEQEEINELWKLGENIALCQPQSNENFEPPFMLIRFASTKEASESLYELKWQSETGQKKFLEGQERGIKCVQNSEGFLPEKWAGAERVSTDIRYDSRHHTLFQKTKLYNEYTGPIELHVVRILGKRRAILIRFYADSDDVETLPELIDETIRSFRFDEGYQFGAGDNMTNLFLKGFFSKRSLLYAFGSFIIISILFGVLKRWAEN